MSARDLRTSDAATDADFPPRPATQISECARATAWHPQLASLPILLNLETVAPLLLETPDPEVSGLHLDPNWQPKSEIEYALRLDLDFHARMDAQGIWVQDAGDGTAEVSRFTRTYAEVLSTGCRIVRIPEALNLIHLCESRAHLHEFGRFSEKRTPAQRLRHAELSGAWQELARYLADSLDVLGEGWGIGRAVRMHSLRPRATPGHRPRGRPAS